MPRMKLHSIKSEFGTWQVWAVNREKALKKLYNFFAAQDQKEKMLEDLSGLVAIPKWLFP